LSAKTKKSSYWKFFNIFSFVLLKNGKNIARS